MSADGSLDETPTFSNVAGCFLDFLQFSYHKTFGETNSSIKMDSWNIATDDIILVAVWIAVLSALRNILEKHIFTPIANSYNIPGDRHETVLNISWKFIYSLCIWFYEWYVIVLSGKHKFFQKPETIWLDWTLEKSPPGDIYTIYVVQFAFNLHWSYSTLYSDTYKNIYVMVLHHMQTFVLLILSYVTRCHNIGILILFLDDTSDAFSYFEKLCVYFKTHGLKVNKLIGRLEYICFASFTVIWLTARIYWFTLKVLYPGAVHVKRLNLDIPYLFVMCLFLLHHIVLNIYWGMGILKKAYRIASGQKREYGRKRHLGRKVT